MEFPQNLTGRCLSSTSAKIAAAYKLEISGVQGRTFPNIQNGSHFPDRIYLVVNNNFLLQTKVCKISMIITVDNTLLFAVEPDDSDVVIAVTNSEGTPGSTFFQEFHNT